MAKILIVEDDKQIVALVQHVLCDEGHTVVVANLAQTAIDLCRAQRPDLLVLDVNLPDMSGIEVCKYVRTHPPLLDLRILFLTQRVEIADRIVGFEAGADDYLGKPFFGQELLYRVRSLLRVAPLPDEDSALVSGHIRIDPGANLVLVDGVAVSLTPMQIKLLHFLMEHGGEVVSTQRLLEQVWGYPPDTGSSSLVRMHILNVRSKIEANPHNPKLIRTIPKHGYMYDPAPDGQIVANPSRERGRRSGR